MSEQRNNPINEKINQLANFLDVLDNVDDHVRINNVDGSQISERTYKALSEVVFDAGTYNFHIFPVNNQLCRELSDDFKQVRQDIIKEITTGEYGGITYIAQPQNKEQYDKASDKKQIYIYKHHKQPDWYGGPGFGEPFTKLTNAEKKHGIATSECMGSIVHLYRFVEIYYKGAYYTINFMRYTCNKKGIVGCTMRAIQFHKATYKYGARMNCNVSKEFEICYTRDVESERRNTIPKAVKGEKQKYTSVCYNPPVDYPFADLDKKEYNKRIVEIVREFINFIESEGKLANM